MEVQSTSSTGRVIRSHSQTENAGPVLNNRVKSVYLFQLEIKRTLRARDAGLQGMNCLCGISEKKRKKKREKKKRTLSDSIPHSRPMHVRLRRSSVTVSRS